MNGLWDVGVSSRRQSDLKANLLNMWVEITDWIDSEGVGVEALRIACSLALWYLCTPISEETWEISEELEMQVWCSSTSEHELNRVELLAEENRSSASSSSSGWLVFLLPWLCKANLLYRDVRTLENGNTDLIFLFDLCIVHVLNLKHPLSRR
ncbi:uncharacterized protein G2W53_031389 [Senna tora]|uniref:Uncharacterized protein n=1 Tax=Senna tora TaxID=362788 RepID=A0A834T997_9FABA|nr:uncharacterized protein G2W53_031389 [Senna tora]